MRADAPNMQRPGTVGAGALLCLRAGEDVRGWLGAPCWLCQVVGGGAGDLAGGGQRGGGAGAYNGQVYS